MQLSPFWRSTAILGAWLSLATLVGAQPPVAPGATAPQVAPARGEGVQEAKPEVYYLKDKDGKLVPVLGTFPLPVEVIPMARSYVGRQIVKLTGGMPQLRAGVTTDNGNLILDVRGLKILKPMEMESELNQLAGVVSNGIFARRPADVLLLGSNEGVKTTLRPK